MRSRYPRASSGVSTFAGSPGRTEPKLNVKIPREPFVRRSSLTSATSVQTLATRTAARNPFLNFNLMVSADCEPTSVSRIRASPLILVELSHAEHHAKNRFRILPGLGHFHGFICAIRAKRRFGGNGKCANQWCCAGPSKRRWNEQCGGRSEWGRQRFQGSPAAAAAHNRPGDSEV